MLLHLSEFRRHKNSSSLRWRGRRTKTDSAPPSGVLRDLLLCHWAVHTQMPSRNASPSSIDSHHQSPVIIHSSPSQPQTPPTSHHFTSNNTFWASEHVSSSSKPTLFYSGLIQHRFKYLPLEDRASHFYERLESSMIERATQPLESQPKPSQLSSSVQLAVQYTLEPLRASSSNMAPQIQHCL